MSECIYNMHLTYIQAAQNQENTMTYMNYLNLCMLVILTEYLTDKSTEYSSNQRSRKLWIFGSSIEQQGTKEMKPSFQAL